jgi:hypothetical protein
MFENLFSGNRAVYEITRKNMEKLERPQTAIKQSSYRPGVARRVPGS